MKKTASFNKTRAQRIKYLKLFPLFIQNIDQVSSHNDNDFSKTNIHTYISIDSIRLGKRRRSSLALF